MDKNRGEGVSQKSTLVHSGGGQISDELSLTQLEDVDSPMYHAD